MAPRSVKVPMERHRTGGGMNDNYPSVLPGHELTGLDGPRPPVKALKRPITPAVQTETPPAPAPNRTAPAWVCGLLLLALAL